VKVLTLDLETAPQVAHVWGLWQQNVGLPQLLESGYVMCFAAKWEHEDKVRFHKGPGMIEAAHKLLNEADVVVHYNGTKFDIPHLQTEMVRAGLVPPSPYVQIDLCTIVKQRFRFPSNKLEYVASELLGEKKAYTGGHGTWIACMAGDAKAWRLMRHYNEQDTLLTERLYQHLKPWIKLPVASLYGDAEVGDITCPGCGSNDMMKRGLAYTAVSAYPRYTCRKCGRWSRGKNRVGAVNAR
jgi:hypothetical protein